MFYNNRMLIAVCFIVLILCGFLFGYLFWVTEQVWNSWFLVGSYYLSLYIIMIQFIQKPTNHDKKVE